MGPRNRFFHLDLLKSYGITLPMRSLRFVPFAFVAGMEGFATFAPYLAVVLLMAHVIRRVQA